MRFPITRFDLLDRGVTPAQIRWRLATGAWQSVGRGVYVEGVEPPTPVERAVADVLATRAVASGTLAALLHALDGVRLQPPYLTVPSGNTTARCRLRTRNFDVAEVTVVRGVPCLSGHATMLDLAGQLSTDSWEAALESALRKGLTSVEALWESLAKRRVGNSNIRRVLLRRPLGAPPTESLLETLMVQLLRKDPELPVPTRQHVVIGSAGAFVARVDLAFPEQRVFVELDGRQHLDQVAYDASRQTRVAAHTGWRAARFTWSDIVYNPVTTLRRTKQLLAS